MPTVDINGATVSYRVDGNGPALVLISGTGGNLYANWDHLMPAFTADRMVLRADYAGTGDTVDPTPILTIERLAEQILAAVEDAGIHRYDLVGYSLGTAIAMHIAAERPQQVRSLTLLAGYACGRDARFDLQAQLWLNLVDRDHTDFARLIMITGLSPQALSAFEQQQVDGWINAIRTSNNWEGLRRQADLDRRLDVTRQLPKIKAPTLSIGCTHDHIVPPQHARAIAAAIPGARYEELPAGHLAVLEQADAFARLVLEFSAPFAFGE